MMIFSLPHKKKKTSPRLAGKTPPCLAVPAPPEPNLVVTLRQWPRTARLHSSERETFAACGVFPPTSPFFLYIYVYTHVVRGC